MSNEKVIDDMSDEELAAYEESLDKKLKLQDIKNKKIAFEAEEAKVIKNSEIEEDADAAEVAKLAKEAEEKVEADKKEFANEQLDEYKKTHPIKEPTEKLETEGEKKTVNKTESFINGFYARNTEGVTKSDHIVKLESKASESMQIVDTFENTTWDKMFENTDSDSGCEDIVTDWSPADVYAKVIWNTFVCKADLFRIAVKGLSINPGQGLKTQIRVYGNLSDPDVKASCECLSCVSIPFTTKTLTLEQIGKEAIICEKDIWEVGSPLMDAYINAFADMWASYFDKRIYDEIETAAPGTTETLGTALNCDPSTSGSCCSDTALVQLYHAVQTIVASMREGTNPYQPDYMIISPTVASIFKRLQTPTRVMGYNDIVWDADGRLAKIGSLKVIEYCRANACSDATGEVMAVIIDSRRAVGAVFGSRPKMTKFFQSNCNSHRLDSWAFFACGEIDTNAIAHIVNP